MMALHPNFLESHHTILDLAIRWFPADEAFWESSMDKLIPPHVSQLRRKVKDWRDSAYMGATDTSKSLLNWWFNTPHLLFHAYLPYSRGRGGRGDGHAKFQYYLTQREALETITYLHDYVNEHADISNYYSDFWSNCPLSDSLFSRPRDRKTWMSCLRCNGWGNGTRIST